MSTFVPRYWQPVAERQNGRPASRLFKSGLPPQPLNLIAVKSGEVFLFVVVLKMIGATPGQYYSR